jgi:hypothetical protein
MKYCIKYNKIIKIGHPSSMKEVRTAVRTPVTHLIQANLIITRQYLCIVYCLTNQVKNLLPAVVSPLFLSGQTVFHFWGAMEGNQIGFQVFQGFFQIAF